jgi:hypothetical protein
MQAPRIPVPRSFRSLSFAWRHGTLGRRVAATAAAASVIALLAGLALAWQAHRQAEVLGARVARGEALRAASLASAREAEPPDAITTLPPAPTVAAIMQTMQRTADAVNARVVSLQAEQHAPTALELGRLDLVVSIKAPYPAILTVLREVLDRYPGATLRQLSLAHAPATATATAPGMALPVAAMPGASGPVVESEARATLAFWSRPLGVAGAPLPDAGSRTGVPAPVSIVAAASGSGAGAPASAAGVAGAPSGAALRPAAVASAPAPAGSASGRR